MKTFMVSLFVAMLVFAAGEAQATREAVLENGTPIVKESTEVMLVPPKELSVDVANDIITGKILGTVVSEIVKGPPFAFEARFYNSPVIKSRIMFVDKLIRYRNGKWIVYTFPGVRIMEGVNKSVDPIGTFFCFSKC